MANPIQDVVSVRAETPLAKRDAIRWLVNRATWLATVDTAKAENCIALAYELDAEVTAREISKRKRPPARD